MGRVQIYNPSQKPSLAAGVPQMDNSGSILASAIGSTTNMLADNQNSIAAQQQQRSLSNFGQNINTIQSIMYHQQVETGRQMRAAQAKQDAALAAQDKVFEADRLNQITSTYKMDADVAETDVINSFPNLSSEQDAPAMWRAGMAKRQQEATNGQDSLTAAKLGPDLRQIDTSAYSRIDNAWRNYQTSQAPLKWKVLAETNNRNGASIGDARDPNGNPTDDYSSPQGVQNILSSYRNNQETVLQMKPGYAMNDAEIAQLRTQTMITNAHALLMNVAKNSPEQLGMFRYAVESLDGIAIAMPDDLIRTQDARAESQIKTNDQVNLDKQRQDVNYNQSNVLVAQSTVVPKDPVSVNAHLEDLDKQITSTVATLQQTKDDQYKLPTQTQRDNARLVFNTRTEFLKDLRASKTTVTGWQNENTARAKQVADAQTQAQKDKLANDEKLEQKTRQATYDAGLQHRINTSTVFKRLMNVVPVEKLASGNASLTDVDKRNARAFINEYKSMFREGLGKYYSPTGMASDLYAGQMSTVQSLEMLLDQPTSPSLVEQFKKQFGITSLFQGASKSIVTGSTNDPSLIGARDVIDPSVYDRAYGRVQKYQADVDAKTNGKDGKPLPPLTPQLIRNIRAEETAKSLTNKVLQDQIAELNVRYNPPVPTERISAPTTPAKTSTVQSVKTSGKVKTKSKNTSLVPPPPPDAVSLGGDAANEAYGRFSSLSPEKQQQALEMIRKLGGG